MQQIHYELGVLAKSIHFKNLSAAAIHVGLSQPQLSRIIAKLEEELKVILLDRSAKRKSGWTPLAFELSKLYEKSIQRFESEVSALTKNEDLTELRIGTLEGLSAIAMQFAKIGFNEIGIKKITLDIYDLSDLDANFLSGNLDLIFTSKIPGRQKFKHLFEIGYQHFDKIKTNDLYRVFSPFEYNKKENKSKNYNNHVLISNSLAVKKDWLKKHGGIGSIPAEPKRGTAADQEPVLLIGSEIISPNVWETLITNYNKK